MGQKVGAALCPLFFWGGGLGPHLTQCGLSQGLPPYQMSSWSIQPKIGVGLCPYGRAELGPPSNTMWPRPRPTSEPSFIVIHPAVWPQWAYTNVTDRTAQTDNRPIANGRPKTAIWSKTNECSVVCCFSASVRNVCRLPRLRPLSGAQDKLADCLIFATRSRLYLTHYQLFIPKEASW